MFKKLDYSKQEKVGITTMVVVRAREEKLSDLDVVLFIGEDAEAGHSYLSRTYGRILSRRITQWTGDQERGATLADETLRYAVEHTQEYHPGTKVYFWLRDIAKKISGAKTHRKVQERVVPDEHSAFISKETYLDALIHSINSQQKVPSDRLLHGVPSAERTFLWLYMNNNNDLGYVHSVLKRRDNNLSDRDFKKLVDRSYYALVRRCDALYH